MDSALSALFSWNLLLFSLAINVVVWLIRTIMEYAIPSIITAKFWNKLLLPILPSIMGGGIAFAVKNYAYPDQITSVLGRLFFGLVAGAFSALLYQVMKGMLKDKIQQMTNDMRQNGGSARIPPPIEQSHEQQVMPFDQINNQK